MNTEKTPTIVVFRAFDDGDIIALLMSLNESNNCANSGMVVDYMHIGQHGESDPYAVVSNTRPASPAEYDDLKRELESLGYVLEVRKRASLRQMLRK